MLRPSRRKHPLLERAPQSGFLRTTASLGDRVEKGRRLRVVADPFGESEVPVQAHAGGIVVGRSNLPLANEGDGLFHIARFEAADEVAAQVEALQSEHDQAIRDEPGDESDDTE